MAVTWADVVVIAPELSTVSLAQQAEFLDDATQHTDPAVWGSDTDRAIKYFAAHLATMAGRRAQHGPVQSEAAGAVSRSYAVDASDYEELDATVYGSRRLSMALSRPEARFAIGGCR